MPSLADLLENYRNWKGRQDWQSGKEMQDYFGGDPVAQEQFEQLSGFGTGSHGVGEMAGGLAGIVKNYNIGNLGYDLRFDPRKLEQSRLNRLRTSIDVPENEPQKVSLADYEGHPFITSMSDRTNVGRLQSINDVPVDVNLQGGQDYMLNSPGQVWASAKGPSNQILSLSNATPLK